MQSILLSNPPKKKTMKCLRIKNKIGNWMMKDSLIVAR